MISTPPRFFLVPRLTRNDNRKKEVEEGYSPVSQTKPINIYSEPDPPLPPLQGTIIYLHRCSYLMILCLSLNHHAVQIMQSEKKNSFSLLIYAYVYVCYHT